MEKCKYIYSVYVEGIGFGETYKVKASSWQEAKKKAKAKAIKDFTSEIKCSMEDKEVNY